MSAYFELRDPSSFDPAAAVAACIESGSRALLLDRDAVPPGFFDLSSGVAGELLHRLSVYGLHMAAVVPDPSRCSQPFQDFVREANRGRQFRFFPTRDDAVRWLESAPPDG